MNETFSFNPERSTESNEERAMAAVEKLLEQLGWDESGLGEKEAPEIREALIEQLRADEGFEELTGQFQQAIEEEIDTRSDDERVRSQFLLSIRLASLWFWGDQVEIGLDALYQVGEEIDNAGFTDMAIAVFETYKTISEMFPEEQPTDEATNPEN
jgi:hypothetical protein